MRDEAEIALRNLLSYVPRRRWADLERDYHTACESASGRDVAHAIAATDTADYETAMAAALAAAVARAVLLKARAVYVEYDPFNDWSSFFALLRKRDNGRDLDWLQETKDHWVGPDFPPFALLWPQSISENPDAAAAAYLAARGLAAFGRAAEGLDSQGITVYFARHDDYDSIVTICPGGRPDYSSISEKQRRATLRAEAAERARKTSEHLGARLGSDEERQALTALATAGAKVGVYPDSVSGVDYAYLENTRAGDDLLAQVARLTCLRALTLGRTKVTDAGLRYLADLRGLQSLSLKDTRITDAGVAHLEPLAALQSLDLSGTAVTDAGLVHLCSLPHLEVVALLNTAVTRDGVARLKEASPRTEVMWF